MRPAPRAASSSQKETIQHDRNRQYAENSERMKVKRREVGKSTAQRKPCVRRILVLHQLCVSAACTRRGSTPEPAC